VSRVFTAGASVAPATREKILKASNALGYKPNVIARSLMTGRTELIGLVSNNFDNPAFMQIFDLFTRNLQDNGLRPLMVNLSGSVDSHEAVGMLRQYNVDGVIIASSTVSPDFLKGCLDARIPLVHAFGRSVRNAPYPIVAADNAQGGRLAAQALIDHGYRRLSVLGGPETASSTRARLKGFRETLAEAGIAILEERFADRYSHDEGYRIMAELLRSEKAEAVFCGDDILAMGAVDACTAAGMSVPYDMGILGFNDISMAAWSSYNLSTIRQPIAEIIVDAVQLMLSMINGEKVGPQNLRKCELVLRGSIQKIDGRPISSVPG